MRGSSPYKSGLFLKLATRELLLLTLNLPVLQQFVKITIEVLLPVKVWVAFAPGEAGLGCNTQDLPVSLDFKSHSTTSLL